MTTLINKPTKAGTKAALLSLGYTNEPDYMPPALVPIQAAETFTTEEQLEPQYCGDCHERIE